MTSLAEIVEAPVDWIGTIDDTVIPDGLRTLAGKGARDLEAGVAAILLEPGLLSVDVLDPGIRRLYTLRRSGLSDEEIAERLGVHPEDVRMDLREALHRPAWALVDSAGQLARSLPGRVMMAPLPPGSRPTQGELDLARGRERLRIGTAFLDELHDLLCSGERYQEEQASLLKEYRAGQSTFVASIAVVLAPHLGAGVQIVAAAVAVTLSVIGQVGLKAWCLTQTERRRTRGTGRLRAEAVPDPAEPSDT